MKHQQWIDTMQVSIAMRLRRGDLLKTRSEKLANLWLAKVREAYPDERFYLNKRVTTWYVCWSVPALD